MPWQNRKPDASNETALREMGKGIFASHVTLLKPCHPSFSDGSPF